VISFFELIEAFLYVQKKNWLNFDLKLLEEKWVVGMFVGVVVGVDSFDGHKGLK